MDNIGLNAMYGTKHLHPSELHAHIYSVEVPMTLMDRIKAGLGIFIIGGIVLGIVAVCFIANPIIFIAAFLPSFFIGLMSIFRR